MYPVLNHATHTYAYHVIVSRVQAPTHKLRPTFSSPWHVTRRPGDAFQVLWSTDLMRETGLSGGPRAGLLSIRTG